MITRNNTTSALSAKPSALSTKKPVVTGEPLALYADSNTNDFVLTTLDRTSKSINASFTSSINFIDHVITKINETYKHADKIKLLALYQQLYSIDEYDYEYIQKKTGIITNYKKDELLSFRDEIKKHPILQQFYNFSPEKRSKDAWRNTKLAIMYEYTCIELNKHFSKVLKPDTLENYVFFNKKSDLCDIVLLEHPNKSSKLDGTHGLHAVGLEEKKGIMTFNEDDLDTESLREKIEENRDSSLTKKTDSSKWSLADWWNKAFTKTASKEEDFDSKEDSEKILIGYFSTEKNGYFKLYGEYYNLWAYIDYHLNANLLSFIEKIPEVKSIQDFWNPSSLQKLTSEDIMKMTKNLREAAAKLGGGDASKATAGGGDASKATAGGRGDGSWRRSPDGRKLRKAYKDGTITRKQYNDGKKSIKGTCK
jgi:hypothetical protein